MMRTPLMVLIAASALMLHTGCDEPATAQAPAVPASQLEYALYDARQDIVSLPGQAVIKGESEVNKDGIVDLARKLGAAGKGEYWTVAILNRLAEDGWQVVSRSAEYGSMDQYLLARPKRR